MDFKRINKIAAIIFLIFLAILIFFSIKKENKLEKECNSYTVGIISNIKNQWTKSFVHFDYIVNQDTFNNIDKIYIDSIRVKLKVGDKFLVKYCNDDYENVKMMFTHPIADTTSPARPSPSQDENN